MPKKDISHLKNDVEASKAFWVCDGQVLMNLVDLTHALKEMSEDVYKSHANKDKNDFADWIKDVMGEKKFSENIRKSRNKESMIKKLKRKLKIK